MLLCGWLFRFVSEYGAAFLILVTLVGAATAAFYGWLPLYLPELFPTRVRATGQGLCYNSGRILAAVGALTQGQLVGAYGGSYAKAGATITLIYVVGLALDLAGAGNQGPALARMRSGQAKAWTATRLPLLSTRMKQKAYARAGVDIDLGNQVKSALPRMLRATHRPEVLGKVGGFGGLFALDVRKYREPVLVSSVDGVGTKLKLAFAMDRHDTIGQDLVNHCVNDIAVLGAEPLFFLDYLGTGRLEPRVFKDIITGFAKACAENHCALIGGETAQMPGFYQPGEYDVSGTIVGVVEKSQMLDGKAIRAGDAVIGLASSGLHTNGYSLARKILFEQMGLKPGSYVATLRNTIGDELLKVHVSYGPLIRKLLKNFNVGQAPRLPRKSSKPSSRDRRDACPTVKALAHITGGGFVDNIPRVLPKGCDVVIRKGTWEVLPIFQLIQAGGGVPEEELYQVFNMGVGMVIIVAADTADEALSWVRAQKQKAWLIGQVAKGRGVARVV